MRDLDDVERENQLRDQRRTDAAAVPDAGDEITVHTVELDLCELCIRGEGGECHTPGCSMWINRAPDLPLDTHPSFRIVPPEAGDDTLRDQLAEALRYVPGVAYTDGTFRIYAESAADALLPLIREHVAAAVQAEREQALKHTADWCAECLTCGKEHQPRPHPKGERYADTYAHPDDGHTYRSRQVAVANWLRAALDGTEATDG